MAKLAIKKASTDVTTYVFIQDSSKTTGEGLAGLAYNTASLVCYYVRPKGSATAITLATQTVTGDHSDGGFKEIDATNMPGVYRLDLPDAVCATGVNSAVVMLKGAANMSPVVLELQLTDLDPNTAAITAAAVADAVWDEATADHTTASSFGALDANVDAILADTGTDGVKLASAQTVATVTNLTNLPSIPANWITAAGVATGAIDADAIASNAITSAKIATGAITNAKFASGAIDAAAIATDAIGSAEISAAAVTKIQSGLALEATLTAIKGAGWNTETLVALKTAIDNITGGGATAQQIWEYATRTLSAATNLPSAADISDAVWNEATTDHTTAGSTGVALTDILTDTSTTLDNKLDIIDVVADTIYAEMGSSAEVADVVWDELLAGHVIGGSAGEKIAAIKAKTDLMNASAITYTPTVSGTTITLRRGDTLSAPLTDTGALTGYVSIDFTVKRRMSDLDDDAIIRIRKNASGTNDGLLRLNAAAPTSSALGSIIVNDVTTGDITITLDETATDDLDTGGYLYDVQLIDADSVLTLTYGKLSVVADVTRAVS